jgi:hypothetical protein
VREEAGLRLFEVELIVAFSCFGEIDISAVIAILLSSLSPFARS